MPQQLLVYRCLVISPSDVESERNAVEAAITSWNAHAGRGLDIRIEPVRWESHARPELGGSAQEQINRQLLNGCDFGVAIFWSRLGNPTAQHPSGSMEEIERLLADGKRVMVYFCGRDIPQDRLRDDQFARLVEARKRFETRGLLATFDTPEELVALVGLHVNGLITDMALQQRAAGQPIPATGTATAPMPDIRVSVRGAIASRGPGESQCAVEIAVQNHSPSAFFMSSLAITLEDLSSLVVQRDCLTGEYLTARTIEPGNAFQFRFDPAEIQRDTGRTPDELLSVVVTDKIERTFRSKGGAVRAAVAEWVRWRDAIRRM